MKARIKKTGEIIEGFPDGKGHFDVPTDHCIFDRYDIDCLEFPEEKPSEDLEKEAVSYCFDNGINLSPRQATDFARHFAQWQKEQDERLIKLAHDSWYKEGIIYGKIEGLSEDEKYQQGRFDMREQMMKEAVIAETNVIYDTRKDVYRYQLTLPENTKNPYRDCRDWKIIIVKED